MKIDNRALEQYVATAPNAQNAVNIFSGAWSSRLPAPYEQVTAGEAPLFEDVRMVWAAEQLGGFAHKTVLELGPLEGAHTYMLEKAGAKEIVAIEANTSAYLRCLIVKELFHLQAARFLCGDFAAYLRQGPPRFDLCIASGVLYHMRHPLELIGLLARVTDRLFLWTHYYDQALIAQNPAWAARFNGYGTAQYGDFACTVYRHHYHAALSWRGFRGGSAQYSHWMTRADILSCLQHFGFDKLTIGFEAPEHPHGPSFAVAAVRTRAELRPRHVDAVEPPEPVMTATPTFHTRKAALHAMLARLWTQVRR
ncbi:MAG: class I SAM-dependent methyltransferase [Caldilineaceae bacterium]|nr:class I SAM-dependent methyltransferase [Caldilineaceae bacterium]